MATLSELITNIKGKMLPLTGGTLTGALTAPSVSITNDNAKVNGKDIVRSVNGTVAGTDGNVAIDSRYIYYSGVANNAGAHNAVYRGDDITSRHADGSLSAQVQAGDFTDIFIGDYITATTTANGSTVTTKWRVADIDYYMNTGDTTDIDANHHLVLVPDACMFNAYMNSTNTTAGGYQGSAMWKTYIPMCVTAIKNAFGASRVLPWRTALSNAMYSEKLSMAGDGWGGSASINWDTGWVTAEADLMSEAQVYGCGVFSSSFADYWTKKTQFSLFRLNRTAMNIRANFWLSSVASSTHFARCDWNGSAGGLIASGVFGVRPHFLYH